MGETSGPGEITSPRRPPLRPLPPGVRGQMNGKPSRLHSHNGGFTQHYCAFPADYPSFVLAQRSRYGDAP